MEHLFGEWEKIIKAISGKRVFIFLDYDGTISPIVESPGKAKLPKRIKALLKRISLLPDFKLAFISGRSLEDLKAKVGLENVIYSGNHGLEIEGPKIRHKSSVPAAYPGVLKEIKDSLERRVSSIRGALVEDKGLSLSLHYRMVDKKQVSEVKTIFHEIAIVYLAKGNIRVRTGKKVLEVMPPVEWDKGKIVLWLLARQIFAERKKKVFPVYIGDDTTDEDAFRALGKRGLSVFVGEPGRSGARYYLRSLEEVHIFLKKLLEASQKSNA